ncbi:succinate dehydrogenase, cytochrome b556 subunit [Mariprofundus erugo]|uniref:succinate dehydrogenase, cytochrome b556 subunit n=1 Tax=Mariprofundus erugo TaxID=2528639 RepID=UPI0010FE5A5C|nr:succinate dehydrogenase, cytochrome b556 subunit [Mariprofundus erugo]TLS76373.1 succinate dehydrogenase, cytochrome b556 subunit [Mariprofundus erugo]
MNDPGRLTRRPLSPRLSVYRWQPAMIASLAHRVSGLILVLFVPLYLWILHGMTGSTDDFDRMQQWLHSGLGRLSLWFVGVALFYHFCNGLRFLSIDAGWCESRMMMRLSARVVIAMAGAAALLLAVLLLG